MKYKKELPTTINKMVQSEYKHKNLKTKRRSLYRSIILIFFGVVIFLAIVAIAYVGGNK